MNLPAFLTEEEVVTLTGYVKPSKQIERLEQRGIPHEVNARGRPVVRRDMDKSAVTVPMMGPVR